MLHADVVFVRRREAATNLSRRLGQQELFFSTGIEAAASSRFGVGDRSVLARWDYRREHHEDGRFRSKALPGTAGTSEGALRDHGARKFVLDRLVSCRN